MISCCYKCKKDGQLVVHLLVNLLLFEIRGVFNVYWHALGYVFLVVTLWWSERDCKKFKCGVRMWAFCSTISGWCSIDHNFTNYLLRYLYI